MTNENYLLPNDNLLRVWFRGICQQSPCGATILVAAELGEGDDADYEGSSCGGNTNEQQDVQLLLRMINLLPNPKASYMVVTSHMQDKL